MKIKEIRIKYGLSQAQLAEIANTSQRTISSYEKSNGTQNIEALIKIADYFHTTIDSIVGHEVPYLLDKGILSNEQNVLIDQIIKLTPRQCELVSTYIIGLLTAEQDKQNVLNKLNNGE